MCTINGMTFRAPPCILDVSTGTWYIDAIIRYTD